MIRTICLSASVLACLAAPVAAAPFHHPFGEWREYNQDWLAACPDVIDEEATDYYGFSCFASTGSAELNDAGLPAYKLTLLRNRLTGVVDIAITVAATALTADPTRPLLLQFGGEPEQSLDFSSDLETRYNTINQFYVVDPARRDLLLDMLKSRNGLVLSVPVSDGAAPSRQVRLSLRGVTASLDFMASYARKVSQY